MYCSTAVRLINIFNVITIDCKMYLVYIVINVKVGLIWRVLHHLCDIYLFDIFRKLWNEIEH